MKKSAVIIVAAICLAITIGMILSAFMLSRFMLKIQNTTEKSIMVKGVAEKVVTSDLAAFNCSIAIKSSTRSEGYASLSKAADLLKGKLDALGFNESMREDENYSCNEMYRTVKSVKNGKEISESIFDHYELTYSVRVRTKDVQVVEKNVLKIYELAAQRLDVFVGKPEYYISNPEQYKLELVDQASASAAERARIAAAQSGSALGSLITARQGVIQITRQASNDTSDYGVYDTTSVNKIIRLVMTMEFALK